GAAAFTYDLSLSTLLVFLTVSFFIFIPVKQITRFRRKEEAKPDPKENIKECPECLPETPKKASRCKYCTAVLEAPAVERA
ncbi:mechanosensitive ion channel protein MscL, partial [Paenibacillus sp. A3]